MKPYTQEIVSDGSSYENVVCGAGSTESFNSLPSTVAKTILAMWECKNCGRLHVDPAADPDCMPNPPTTECVTNSNRTVSCRFERLDHFGSIDLTDGQSCSGSELEILHMSDYWNGICKNKCWHMEVEHRHFECGTLVDAAEEIGTEKRSGLGPIVMVGTCLAFWGGLVAAASML